MEILKEGEDNPYMSNSHLNEKNTVGWQKKVIWNILDEKSESAEKIKSELSLNPIVSRILANRGASDAKEAQEFLTTSLSSLNNPFLFKDMEKSVERIGSALKNKEPILVYGDYDADGITSIVVLLKTLKWFEADPPPAFYVPHRIQEGYGLNIDAIKQFASQGISLIITVDTGISSAKEVEFAKQKGIDVIITDHHQPPEILPDAYAIINPNQAGCSYPHTNLSGVGISFKLAHALLKKLAENQDKAKRFLLSMLDLVALGTVADMVPLCSENRAIVKFGLEKLAKTENIGLSLMLEKLGVDPQSITTDQVGYLIAPRLNVAGRTDHAKIVVDLLLCTDITDGAKITHYLDELNSYRRTIESDILKEAIDTIEKDFDLDNEKLLVITGSNWHLGVIGIVASKLVDKYNRPVIILSKDGEIAKGSARSVSGFDIFSALTSCQEFFIEFGGHKMAAGLTLSLSNFEAFKTKIYEYVNENLNGEISYKLDIDTFLKGEEINEKTIEAISLLGPFGQANQNPLFYSHNVKNIIPPKIVGDKHLKLRLDIDGYVVDAIGFSMAEYFEKMNQRLNSTFSIAFLPYINDWMGNRKVEIEIKDIKLAKD